MSKMLDALREKRAAVAAEASALLDGEPTNEALETVEARQAELASLDEQIKSVEETEARAAVIAEAKKEAEVRMTGSAQITREVRTYDEHTEHSFVRDMVNAQLRNDRDAWDRLHRHMDESRAASRTDTTSAGELVPPAWLLDLTAMTLRPGRVAANLVSNMALPAGTDSINIPSFAAGGTGTDVGVQTADNQSTTTQDIVTKTVTAPVRTISGYEDVAIQLVDQSPIAGGLDRLIFTDLMKAYDYKLNSQVIQGVGTAGEVYGILNASGIGTVTYTAGTPTAAGLGTAISQAISGVAKTRYEGAEAILMHPSLFYSLVGMVDTNGRPLVVPTSNGPWNAQGVVTVPGQAQGAAGTILGLPVYVDPSIAASSSQYHIIVGRFSDSILFESGIRTRVLPDVGSATLTVRFQLYGYAALLHRIAQGYYKVSGTGTVPITGY